MLDDSMGPAVLVKTNGEYYTATIELGVQFVAPARCGPLYGTGRIVSMGKSVAFLSGELRDADGALLATGRASARLIPTARLPQRIEEA
jgi:acyl-coenzyme A thioesterase PaaI-like protein